jgi:hypothetical protein
VSSRLEADEDAERYVLVRETVEDGTAVRNGTRPSAAMRRPTRSGTGRRATASRNGKTDPGGVRDRFGFPGRTPPPRGEAY